MRSTSTPQKSKMKPWQSDELMWSSSSGAVSSGGVQNTVSRMVCPTPSGNAAGDQWLSPATRENDTLLSGLRLDLTWPPAKTISSASVFNWLAAMRASRPAMRSAASFAVPATAGAKRLAELAYALDQASFGG